MEGAHVVTEPIAGADGLSLVVWDVYASYLQVPNWRVRHPDGDGEELSHRKGVSGTARCRRTQNRG